jgi:DNA-binding NtrC family response regulator
VPPLARHFVRLYCDRFGVGPFQVPDAMLDRLRALPWRGNVRELENAMERWVALSPPDGLDPALLLGAAGAGALAEPGAALGLRERVEAYERGLVVEALRGAGGNRSEAARRLGISRVTLHDKLRKWGLEKG